MPSLRWWSVLWKGSPVREGKRVGGGLQSGMGRAGPMRGEDMEAWEENVHALRQECVRRLEGLGKSPREGQSRGRKGRARVLRGLSIRLQAGLWISYSWISCSVGWKVTGRQAAVEVGSSLP